MARLSNRPQLSHPSSSSQGLNFTVPSWPRSHNQQNIQNPVHADVVNKKDHDELKRKYLQQNTALARTNSVLRNGMSELERQVQQLVSENIRLKAKEHVANENRKSQMDDELAILETGIASKLRDVFAMFESIRRREGLPSSVVSLEFSNVDLDSFKGSLLQNTGNYDAGASNRRRKSSSRRQSSLFIHSPDNPVGLVQQHGPPKTVVPMLTPRSTNAVVEEPTKSARSHEAFESAQKRFESLLQDHSTDMSISDYSIPEESPRPESRQIPRLRLSEANIVIEPEVRNTSPQKTPQKIMRTPVTSPHKKPKSVSLRETTQKKLQRASLSSQQAKQVGDKQTSRRKTMGCPIERPLEEDSIFSATRETRRKKPVNYAEPSLNKKMRRQSEKFVDAVYDSSVLKIEVPESTQPSETQKTPVVIGTAVAESTPPSTSTETNATSTEQIPRPSTAESLLNLESAETMEMIPVKPRRNVAVRPKSQDRIPLSNVTNQRANTTKRKSFVKHKESSSGFSVFSDDHGVSKKRPRVEDMSIFDFVDDPEEYYAPNKRKTSFGNDTRGLMGRANERRRHSMM
ncbi:unnamed protein product [Kuraishia capsulata CBS 1993]|uniref:Shugoshin C-terminal domain-containing protein n=1 Tax=Kuraishia capsulata CBS 1993 TaxID=1382522 RepID=W6ML25_9ASCO|nr:uncharacterized protein KUCA_T00001457001 [Kuraishia capsulata CBS 1993]CDK25487.1 unnamed protein product [Kuraishia capsulata CBS 1993]